MTDTTADRKGLKRELGTGLLTVYGLGTILGAGVYVVIGEVAGEAGRLTPLAYLLAALAAGLTALSFAEIVARVPRAGGPVAYADRAFGDWRVSTATGWALASTGVVSAATIATGFEGYLSVFFDAPKWAVIAGVVVALTAVAIAGMKESAWLMAVTTGLGLLGLLYVLWLARGDLAEAPARLVEDAAGFEMGAAAGLFAGMFLAFYSFIGFEDMANTAEEVRDVKRAMPKALLAALLGALVLYLLVSMAAVNAVEPSRLAEARAPLVEVARAKGGSAFALGAVSLLIIVNGALAQIIMASRLLMALGRDRRGAPDVLGRVSKVTDTPVIATLLVGAVVLTLALLAPLKLLASATSFIMLGVFALVNVALIVLKRRGPDEHAIDLPMIVPMLGALVSLGMMGGAVLTGGGGH